MNKNEENLRKALSEETAFDRERARTLKEGALEMFNAKMRKIQRIAFAYLAGCVAVALFAAFQFNKSTTTKQFVLYGIIFLVAIETQVLIKLWYWVANTKISILQEIKRLRLEMPEASPKAPAKVKPAVGLSRWERLAWLLLIVLGAFAIGFFIGPSQSKPVMTSERYVTIADDGSGSVVTKMSFGHYGLMPMTTFDFYSDGPLSGARCMDERGRQLSARVESKGTGYQHVWTLLEPIMFGEGASFKIVWDASSVTRKEGDLWVYESGQNWGFASNHYEETVFFPTEAEIVSVTPEPTMRFKASTQAALSGLQGLGFKADRDAGDGFRITLKYRLPQ